jgi:2-keto-3-deoxy-6-phosphogluconate aldolase
MLGRAGLLAVVRCSAPLDVLLEVGDALLAAPLPVLAIAPGSHQPWEAVAELRGRFGKHMAVGMGMLQSSTQVEAAIAAGAQFVLASPLDPAQVDACVRAGVSYLPGVRTVVQLQEARNLGCAGVLLFPTCRMVPTRLAELRATAPGYTIVAVGGIRPEEMAAYRRAGATAVAVRGILAAQSKWVMADMIRTVRRLRLNLDSPD